MEYPHLSFHIQNPDLIEHFTLTPEERFLLSQLRDDTNKIGFAVFLKSFSFLGYPLREKESIPAAVVSYIGHQLSLNSELFSTYHWKGDNRKKHLAIIRNFTGYHPCNADEIQKLIQWLVAEGNNHPSRSKIFFAAIKQCRHLRIELPTEKEVQKLINSAWRQYLDVICQRISHALSLDNKKSIGRCLNQEIESNDRYEWMKANTGKFGIKNLLNEIKRLQFIASFDLDIDILKEIPNDIINLLRERAAPEVAHQMRRHPSNYRYALMVVFLHFRQMEVTDNVIDIFLQLINRIEKKADTKLEKELTKNIRTVYKKRELLYKIAKASTQNPYGTVENVLFPAVGKEVFEQIVAEYEGQELR